MNVTAERIPDSQAILNIEVESELVEKYLERAYRKLVNRVNVPGFRRGKAPRFMVERMVGKEALFHEGVDLMFPDVFKNAMAETGLKPFDTPQYEIVQEQPLTLKVTVPLEPTVELGDYEDIRMSREPVEVTDEEVQAVVERLRDQQTTWAPVDRPAALDDRVTIDIEGHIKEQPLLEGVGGSELIAQKGSQILKSDSVDYPVKAQPESFLPGFGEQLVGLSASEEKEFTIVLPANYPEEPYAGKEAVFHVYCHSVREQSKPEPDDEFAKTVGDFETFEAMLEAIRQDMQKQKTAHAEKHFNDDLIRTIVERSKVDIPPSLVEHEAEHSFEHLMEQVKKSGMTLDRYLSAIGKREDEIREDYRTSARRRLATALVLAEVAKRENIEVSPEDVEEEIQRMTQGMTDEEVVKARATLDNPETRKEISYGLWDRKVIKRLVDIATGEAEPEASAQPENPDEKTALEESATE
ncbi:MAG: trigger factor [Chloroflexi bacterium]|nr:trigger factor [Chloroflexota bacterium]